jgi:CHAD domain-containing protein
MVKSTLFYQYLGNCFEQMQKSVKEYPGSKDLQALFRFRVCIKKIRACLQCIEYFEGKESFSHTRKGFKKFFRKGGELRELQLYNEWFRRHHLLRFAKLIGLHSDIARLDHRFIKAIDETLSRIKHEENHITPFARKLSQEKVKDYYLELLKETYPVMCEKDPNQWHQVRKKLKRVLYARHWQEGEALRILSKRQAEYLDELQHLIGYWHDNRVMISWLSDQRANKESENKGKDSHHVLAGFSKALQVLEATQLRHQERVVSKLNHCEKILGPLKGRLSKATNP